VCYLEYVYTALLLHSVGQKVNEKSVKKVLDATGVKVDEAKVKSLVSSLEGVNIGETIKQTAIPVAAAPQVKEQKVEKEEKKKKPEEEEKKVEEAATGLASLFG